MDIQRLTGTEKDAIEKCGISVTLHPGQTVYNKGDPAVNTYYIKKGRVRIWDLVPSGREITLDVIETGHMFGESAFASSAARPVNVQAVTTTTLIAFQMKDLLEQSNSPQLALHLLQLTSDSMDRLTERIEAQLMLDRFGKTASYLLDVTAVESRDKGTLNGEVPYTHSELACALGLNRTTVSEVLKYFDQKKWVSCGYGKIRVLDREKLQAFVQGQKG